MIICKVLDVAPEWLLSGAEVKKGKRSQVDWYVIDKRTDLGALISVYNQMTSAQKERLIGYAEALVNGR